MLICNNVNELAKGLAEHLNQADSTHFSVAQIEHLLNTLMTKWESVSYEMVHLDGKAFTLPSHVAGYIRSQREQIRQLQTHSQDLQRQLSQRE